MSAQSDRLAVMGRDALRAEVREHRIGPNGERGGTSWLVNATVEEMRTALLAFHEGRVLDNGDVRGGIVSPAPVAGIGAAFEALLQDVLSRPTLDVDAVRKIAEDVAKKIAQERGISRIVVSNPREANVDVGAQHARFPLLVKLMGQGIPVILTGPKGSGKSEAVKAAARAMTLPFMADSFSADSGRHDIFGFIDANSRYVPTAFRPAFQTGAVYCADEVDNGTANLGAALNLALSNGHANFPDESSVARHENFRFAATCNVLHGPTLSHPGREPLDGAFMDRCAVIEWPIDTAFERALARSKMPAEDAQKADAWVDTVQAVRAAMDAAGLDRFSPSPRASIHGAVMLASGLSRTDALEVFIFRGADADTRARIAKAAK